MSTISLTDTQRQVLSHAIEHTDDRIEWFPEQIKGGARKKVLDGLTNRGLVTRTDNDYAVSTAAYDALELPRPSEADESPALSETVATEDEPDAEGTACVAPTAPIDIQPAPAPAETSVARTPRTRAHSKQAQVIELLRRPEGTTIAQVCELTGWQQHSTRGFFAGAVKKKLGLNVVSEKTQDSSRVYRIV